MRIHRHTGLILKRNKRQDLRQMEGIRIVFLRHSCFTSAVSPVKNRHFPLTCPVAIPHNFGWKPRLFALTFTLETATLP